MPANRFLQHYSRLWMALSDQFFGSSLVVVASAMSNPFRYFNSSPEIIRLAVLMYVKHPLSLRNVEDLLAERRIDISHETDGPVKKAGSAHAWVSSVAVAFE